MSEFFKNDSLTGNLNAHPTKAVSTICDHGPQPGGRGGREKQTLVKTLRKDKNEMIGATVLVETVPG
jgi:hypothetical protein